VNALLEQLDYDHWANHRLIDAMNDLDSQSFRQKIASSFPSIHQTLVHILWAEELWLERWQGRSFIRSLELEDFPSLSALRTKLHDIHAKQLQFLVGLPAEAADRVVGYVNFRGERWEYTLRQMVLHLTMHSAYHRGQLATLLRQLGRVPPSTDYLVFVDNKSSAGAKEAAGVDRTTSV
jgi:uncharacterized damage-inducible protein DinB